MDFAGIQSCLKSGDNEYILRTSTDVLHDKICSVIVKNGAIKTIYEIRVPGEKESAGTEEIVQSAHTEGKEYIQLLIEFANNMPCQMDNALWRDRLGMGFFNLAMYDEAAREFKKAIERNPDFSQGYDHLGRALFNLCDFEGAIKHLETAVRLNPDFADFHEDLAEAYLRLGHCQEAFDSANRAVIINAFFGRAYYTRALSLLKNAAYMNSFEIKPDFPEKVRNDLSKAVSIDPSLKDNNFKQAWEYLSQNCHKEAFDLLEKSPLMAGSQKFSQQKLGTFLKLASSFEDNDPENILKFISYLEEKLDQNPQYADLHYELGAAHSILAKLFNIRASRHYKRALEVNPSYAQARENIQYSQKMDEGTEELIGAILGTRAA